MPSLRHAELLRQSSLFLSGLDANDQEVTSTLNGDFVDWDAHLQVVSQQGFRAANRRIFLHRRTSGDMTFALTARSQDGHESISGDSPSTRAVVFRRPPYPTLSHSRSLRSDLHNADLRHLNGTYTSIYSTCIVFHRAPTYTLRQSHEHRPERSIAIVHNDGDHNNVGGRCRSASCVILILRTLLPRLGRAECSNECRVCASKFAIGTMFDK